MLEVCIMIIFRHYQIKKVMAGGPNLQGMDSLTAAMQNNIVPDQEYLLQVPFIKEDLFLILYLNRVLFWTARWMS